MHDETHGSVLDYARQSPTHIPPWKVACLRAFVVLLIPLDLAFLVLAPLCWINLAQGASSIFAAVLPILVASLIVILALLGKFMYWFVIGELQPLNGKTGETIERLSRALTYHAILGVIMFLLFLFDNRLSAD